MFMVMAMDFLGLCHHVLQTDATVIIWICYVQVTDRLHNIHVGIGMIDF